MGNPATVAVTASNDEETRRRDLKLAVAILRVREPLAEELGHAIAGQLQALAYETTLVRDGDAAGLQADVLLFVANSTHFRQYPQMLRDLGASRPHTILWQMDALPPTEMSAKAEQTGLRAAAVNDRLALPDSGLLGQLKRVVPERGRRRLRRNLYKISSKSLYWRARRQMNSQPDWPWRQFDLSQVRGFMQSYDWIRRGRAEGWLDQIWVSIGPRLQFLASRGIGSSLVPVGYYPGMGRDLGQPRDIDVLYLGGLKPRRRYKQILAIRTALRQHGVDLVTVTSNCYGSERCALLNRAKTVLSLNSNPWNIPWIRYQLSTACGALFVTERQPDPRPYQPGIHYVEADLDALPETLLACLRHPERSQQIVAAAQQFIGQELTMKRLLNKMLEQISMHSDTIATEDS